MVLKKLLWETTEKFTKVKEMLTRLTITFAKGSLNRLFYCELVKKFRILERRRERNYLSNIVFANIGETWSYSMSHLVSLSTECLRSSSQINDDLLVASLLAHQGAVIQV